MNINYSQVAEQIFTTLVGANFKVESFDNNGTSEIDPKNASRFVSPQLTVNLDRDRNSILMDVEQEFAKHHVIKLLKSLAAEHGLDFDYKVFGRNIKPKRESIMTAIESISPRKLDEVLPALAAGVAGRLAAGAAVRAGAGQVSKTLASTAASSAVKSALSPSDTKDMEDVDVEEAHDDNHNDKIYAQMHAIAKSIGDREEVASERRRKIFHPEEFEDQVRFSVNSDKAQYAVTSRWGEFISQDEDGHFVAPRKIWSKIEQTAYDADGVGAEEIIDEGKLANLALAGILATGIGAGGFAAGKHSADAPQTSAGHHQEVQVKDPWQKVHQDAAKVVKQKIASGELDSSNSNTIIRQAVRAAVKQQLNNIKDSGPIMSAKIRAAELAMKLQFSNQTAQTSTSQSSGGMTMHQSREVDTFESSDPSGIFHAAKHLNKSFLVKAEMAQGGTKTFRVKAQSERVAREKFAQHHAQAKVLSVKEEQGMAEGSGEKTPEYYEKLAKKHDADAQKGTKANMDYASKMAGRARKSAAILKQGGSQAEAWSHYQGTDKNGMAEGQQVNEESHDVYKDYRAMGHSHAEAMRAAREYEDKQKSRDYQNYVTKIYINDKYWQKGDNNILGERGAQKAAQHAANIARKTGKRVSIHMLDIVSGDTLAIADFDNGKWKYRDLSASATESITEDSADRTVHISKNDWVPFVDWMESEGLGISEEDGIKHNDLGDVIELVFPPANTSWNNDAAWMYASEWDVRDHDMSEGLSEMDRSQPSSDRGGESSGDPYAKGGKATPAKAKDVSKDALKLLKKAYNKSDNTDQDLEEGFKDDLKKLFGIIGLAGTIGYGAWLDHLATYDTPLVHEIVRQAQAGNEDAIKDLHNISLRDGSTVEMNRLLNKYGFRSEYERKSPEPTMERSTPVPPPKVGFAKHGRKAKARMPYRSVNQDKYAPAAYDEKKAKTRKDIEDYFYRKEIGENMTKQSVTEGFGHMLGSTKTSYQPLDGVKIIVRHKAPVAEEVRGSRSRNIKEIFIQRGDERFKMRENSLQAARAMARHVHSGGEVYDQVGKAINEMATEQKALANFVRFVTRSGMVNETNQEYVDLATKRVQSIRETFRKLMGPKTYANAVEHINNEVAVELTETDLDLESKFTSISCDQRVTNAVASMRAALARQSAFESAIQEAINKEDFGAIKHRLQEQDAIEFENATARLAHQVSQLSNVAQDARLGTYLNNISKKIGEGIELEAFETKTVKLCLERAKCKGGRKKMESLEPIKESKSYAEFIEKFDIF